METRIVATVHDSIEIISPDNEVEKALEVVYNELVNYPFMREKFGIEFSVPFKIDAEVGNSFGDGVEVEFKNGKPVCVPSS